MIDLHKQQIGKVIDVICFVFWGRPAPPHLPTHANKTGRTKQTKQTKEQSINQSINQSIHQSINPSIHQSIDQSIHQTNKTNKQTTKPTNQQTNKQTNKQANKQTNKQTTRQTNKQTTRQDKTKQHYSKWNITPSDIDCIHQMKPGVGCHSVTISRYPNTVPKHDMFISKPPEKRTVSHTICLSSHPY